MNEVPLNILSLGRSARITWIVVGLIAGRLAGLILKGKVTGGLVVLSWV